MIESSSAAAGIALAVCPVSGTALYAFWRFACAAAVLPRARFASARISWVSWYVANGTRKSPENRSGSQSKAVTALGATLKSSPAELKPLFVHVTVPSVVGAAEAVGHVGS